MSSSATMHAISKLMCRACLKEGETDFQQMGHNSLEIYYMDLTSIKVSVADQLTTMICSKCSILLTNFHAFKETCIHSNNFLIQQVEDKILMKNKHHEYVTCDYIRDDEAAVIKNEAETPEGKETHSSASMNLSVNPLQTSTEITSNKLKLKSMKSDQKQKKPRDKKIQYKQILEENGFIQCPHCTKQFVKINTYYKHKRDHFVTHCCHFCGIICATGRSLSSHYLFKHSDERKHPCIKCNHAFKTKASLQNHLDTKHQTERNFVCDRCSGTFKAKKSLLAHIRLVHSNMPLKFECDQCDRKFKTSAILKFHLQSHAGVRPYACEICGKAFATKKSRDIHHGHHESKPDRPFQCHLCFQIFKTIRYHRRHMINMHPDCSKAPPIKYAGSQPATEMTEQPKVPSQVQNETEHLNIDVTPN